ITSTRQQEIYDDQATQMTQGLGLSGDPFQQRWFDRFTVNTEMLRLKFVRFSKAQPCRVNIENARLIAAAPELFGAAQLALQIAEHTIRSEFEGPSNSPTFNAMMAELDPVRSVLSKARGETQ
ncbi:hypothetical protein, partial [Roseibium sp. TrichSKD4]|uniref:hypothetical protein n=1 Tax=Roseibium sp. TrichSKD4 TaxID=744980 RepID=UPI00058C4629